VSRVIVKVPNALRTCHNVEVIGFVSIRDDDGMVTPRYEDDIAVLHGHGLVNVTRVAVDAVEDEALRRIDAMIIGFLELALQGDIVDVVFVRRIARGVSAWSPDLDDEDGLGGLILGQDVADVSDIGTFSACGAGHVGRLDEPCRKFPLCGRTGNTKLGIGFGGHGEVCAWRQVNRIGGSVFENAHASPDILPIKTLSLSGDDPAQNDHAKLVGVVGKAQRRTGSKLVSRKANIAPSRRLRSHRNDLFGVFLGFDKQIHALIPL
jgi:hypothetical protein